MFTFDRATASKLKPYRWSGGIKKIVLFLFPLFPVSSLSRYPYSHSPALNPPEGGKYQKMKTFPPSGGFGTKGAFKNKEFLSNYGFIANQLFLVTYCKSDKNIAIFLSC